MDEIVAKAKQGDQEAFAELYSKHKRHVFKVCCQMIKDPIEAEDLTQDVFILVFRKLHQFDGYSTFSTWIHRITVNRVLMSIRKNKKICMMSIDGGKNFSDPWYADNKEFMDVLLGDDSDLIGTVDRVVVSEAIDKLPEKYKVLTFLHEIEGYSATEISRIKGLSIGIVKNRLTAARRKLRRSVTGTVKSMFVKGSSWNKIKGQLTRYEREHFNDAIVGTSQNPPGMTINELAIDPKLLGKVKNLLGMKS